jgi:hypothetical protein
MIGKKCGPTSSGTSSDIRRMQSPASSCRKRVSLAQLMPASDAIDSAIARDAR